MPTGFNRAATIVVADDEWLFRESLRQLLIVPPPIIKDVYGVDIGAGFDVTGEADSGENTLSIVESTKPDLLILDLDMPRKSGLDVLRELRAASAPLRTIVLSGNVRKSDLLEVIGLGVHGVLLKDAPTEALFEAILSVLAGGHWLDQRLVADVMAMVRSPPHPFIPDADPFGLTEREREVLDLVAAGYTNKEIACACAISEVTVKHHLTRMFNKVGASNRREFAMIATKSGLVRETAGALSTQPAQSRHFRAQ
jgi:two-component system, NarL family, response regulator YdfI